MKSRDYRNDMAFIKYLPKSCIMSLLYEYDIFKYSSYRNDKDVAMRSASLWTNTLRHVTGNLIDNEKVVYVCLMSSGDEIKYASDRIRTSKKFTYLAIDNGASIDNIHIDMLNNNSILSYFIKRRACCYNTYTRIRTLKNIYNKQILLKLINEYDYISYISRDGYLIKNIPIDPDYVDIICIILNHDYKTIKYIDPYFYKFINIKSFISSAIQKNSYIDELIQHIPHEIKNDKQFIINVLDEYSIHKSFIYLDIYILDFFNYMHFIDPDFINKIKIYFSKHELEEYLNIRLNSNYE